MDFPNLPIGEQIQFITPLDDDSLTFQRMSGSEELGRLFRFEIEVLCNNVDLDFEQLLGQKVTVRLSHSGMEERYFNGYVSRIRRKDRSVGPEVDSLTLTVHPWLWFLTRTANCRIFQGQTVPEIIKEVFRDNGFTDFEERLDGKYRTWDYCVQYRETDFNFVSRLMEQEGIYYYFTHETDKHTLVLADAASSHEPWPGYEELPYYPPEDQENREEPHIYDWNVTREIQPGTCELKDFDFERPKADIQVSSVIEREHDFPGSKKEVFDYPGEYVDTGDGDHYVKTRIQELQVDYEQIQGLTTARGIAAGHLFRLTGYPREDQNREYLVVSTGFQVVADEQSDRTFDGSFSVLYKETPFRPARITPKPIVQGPQTAIVTGPSGDEIHTDKFGRVKVQFHWDRNGQEDENSSCWVRAAQVWAGKQWGGIHIPRIGQEVIVEFLEGDPDRPIITGRVYNYDNMPPYDLPANATQSGIKSRTSQDGNADNYNEIRFEDKAGEEQFVIQAEKDQEINIKNNRSETVGNDSSLDIGNDSSETVGNDSSLEVTNEYNVTADKIVVEAWTSIELKVGQSSILIESGGITINTTGSINLESTGDTSIEATGSATLKGTSGVTVESPAQAKVDSSGITTIKGSLVQIN